MHSRKRFFRVPGVAFIFLATLWALPAHAGMTVYDLTDVARLRLEDISFFIFLLLLSTLGIRLLWNYFARDFPKLPRLTFFKAFCLTGLLGLGMLLVLVMISGARELMTPGAWNRQGSHYRLNDVGNADERRHAIESLRSSLLQYAAAHDRKFPPHDYVPEIPARIWEAPDSTSTRYVYIAGLTLDQTNAVLAIEPQNFGDERLVLFADGKVQLIRTPEIHRLLGVKENQ